MKTPAIQQTALIPYPSSQPAVKTAAAPLQKRMVIDPKRIPLPAAKFYQQEQIMRIVDAAATAFGFLGVMVSIGVLLTCSPGVACANAVAGLVCSIALLTFGMLPVKKEYWHDQQFVDRVAEKVQNQPFDKIIAQYGWTRTSQNHFISKDRLTEKFLEKIQQEGLNYLAVHHQFGEMIRQYKFIDWSRLRPLLMKEIEALEMSIETFKKRYGNQPLIDGVFDANDSWYTQETAKGIKNKNYAAIKESFALELERGIISKEAITKALMAQYATQSSVEAFMYLQGGKDSFWKIIHDGILEASFFSNDLTEETTEMTVAEIIGKFDWRVFESGMLLGPNYRERFHKNEKETPFSQIIKKFGGMDQAWNLFNLGLAEPKILRPNALKEIAHQKLNFEQIISTYTWKAFVMGILAGSDPDIRNAFIKLAKQKNFCPLWDSYNQSILTHHLLPAATENLVTDLAQRKLLAEKSFDDEMQKHRAVYEMSIQQALANKDSEINHAQSSINQLKGLITTENARFAHEKSSIEIKIREQRQQLATVRRKILNEKPKDEVSDHVQPGTRLPNTPPTETKTDTSGRVIPAQRNTTLDNLKADERRLITLIPQMETRLLEIIQHHDIMLRPLQVQLHIAEDQYTLVKKAAVENYQIALKEAAKQRSQNEETGKAILMAKKGAIDAAFALHTAKL